MSELDLEQPPPNVANGEGAAPNGEQQAGEEPPKKRGKPKDPNAPPRPKNAFQQVTGEARKKIKEERPEVAKDLSAMGLALKEVWEATPQEEKDRMQAQYEKEMEVWRPLWAAYKETEGYKDFFELKQDWVDGRMKKKLIKKYAKEAPKRPKSGYMIFAGEIRDRVKAEVDEAGGGMGDIGKKISEEWNALSEAKKAEYGEQSARQKEVYDVEYAKYRLTEQYAEFMDEKAKLESKQHQKKLIRTKFRDAPKKPAGAFGLYRSEIMPQIKEETKGLSTGELAKKLAEMWKAVPEEQKAPYLKKAEEGKAVYDKQLLEFRKKKVYTAYLKERMMTKLRENRLLNLRDAPKKPKSVFALYAERHKKEVTPGKGAGKGSSALKEKFSTASQEEKEELEAKSKELKRAYLEEVKTFKESDKYKTYEKTDKAVKRELATAAMKVMTIKFLSAAPEQPPKSPFAVFVHEKRKAAGAPEGEKQSKEAKREEVAALTKEWQTLDRPSKAAYETTYKDRLRTWEADVKGFMSQDVWKEYLAEAKDLKVPVKNLLAQKAAALKQLSGAAGMPARPETMPTRPPDAYKVFCKEKEAEGGANGDSNLVSVWQEMSAEAKAKYFTEAGKLTDQFEKDMNEFKKTDEGKTYIRDVNRILRLRKIKSAKKLYLKDMPKAPPSALKVFMSKTMAELKAAQPDLKGFEAKKQAEEKWKAMNAEERQELEGEAREKYQDFQSKMGAFKQTPEFVKFTRAKLVSAPPPKPTGAPVKPMDAFRSYCKEMKGMGKSKEELKKAFDELPEEDKAERKRKASELSEQYVSEVAAFKKTPEWKEYTKQRFLHSKRSSITLAKSKFCAAAPKKPPGAFQLFMQDKRSEIAKDNPDLKGAPALMTKASAMWKEMGQDEKAPWLEKEKAEKEAFDKAKTEYEATEDYKNYMKVVNRYSRGPRAKAKAKGKAKGKAKAAGKAAPKPPPEPEDLPKRPPIAPMQLFTKEKKGMNLKAAHTAWVELGAEGQKQYVDQLKEMQKEYAEKFKEFQKSAEGKKYLRLKNAFDKKQREQKARKKFLGGESAPKEPKRPMSAYFIFASAKRESIAKELGSGKTGDVAKKLTEVWGSLTPEEKKAYEDQAKEQKETYEKAMEEFKASDSYKKFNKAVQGIKKKPKARPKARAAAKKVAKKATKAKAPAAGRGGGRGRGRGRAAGRGAAAAAEAAASDSDESSDAMGSDSSSSSSSDADSD